MTISRILVPTDFSPDADAAFAYALELASALGASVDLLHVVEDPLADVWPSDMSGAEVGGLHIDLVRAAKERLRRCAPMIAGVAFGVFRHVRLGNPPAEIVERAQESAADLIVMGTAGQTHLSHLLAGSVAERVLGSAPCPVLLVKPRTTYETANQVCGSTKVPA